MPNFNNLGIIINMKIKTNSAKETIEYASKLAKKLKGGEVIGLIGNLGVGKTIFSKGLAKGLSIKDTITSPTFVVMKIYDVKNHPTINKFCHIDAYRLSSAKDIEAVGALEYMKRDDTVTAIEWPDRIKKILPNKTRFYELDR